MTNKFWQSKPLHELSENEWESLCDGCGKCCLQKLEDEYTGDIYYTRLACQLLHIPSCRCKDYLHRTVKVPDCIKLTINNLEYFHWLPETCAYRLRAEDKPLPDWHPLVSGCATSTHKAGMSVKQFVRSELDIPESQWADYIIPTLSVN